MTYPLKFRQRVLETRERERLTIAAIALRFGVGVASVVRWLEDPAPRARRNKPATKIDMAALAQDVIDHPDACHCERAQRMGVSRRGVCDAMKRLGVTVKKNTGAPKGRRRIAYQLSGEDRSA